MAQALCRQMGMFRIYGRSVLRPSILTGVQAQYGIPRQQDLVLSGRHLTQPNKIQVSFLSDWDDLNDWKAKTSEEFKRAKGHESIKDQIVNSFKSVGSELESARRLPNAMYIIGLCGLAPFVYPAGIQLLAFSYMPHMAQAQCLYGAIIISFIGGLRWGKFLNTDDDLNKADYWNITWSVLPSILAWVSMGMSPRVCLIFQSLLLTYTYKQDYANKRFPDRFLSLRFILTFFAVCSLLTSLTCSIVFKRRSKESPRSVSYENRPVSYESQPVSYESRPMSYQGRH